MSGHPGRELKPSLSSFLLHIAGLGVVVAIAFGVTVFFMTVLIFRSATDEERGHRDEQKDGLHCRTSTLREDTW